MSDRAEISYLSLPEALQDVFLRQRSGVLAIVTPEERQRFFVLAGHLHLSPDNPCYEKLERVLRGPAQEIEDPRFDADRYLAKEFTELVRELADVLAAWEARDLRFAEVEGDLPDGLLGPLPTASLVMESYSRDWSSEELLRRLGGKRATYTAKVDPRYRRRVPYLDREEIELLERLGKSASVAQLVAEYEDGPALICRLVRLSAVGLVDMESEVGQRSTAISREVLATLEERVREDLEERPLSIDRDQHRARVGRLLGRYGRLGYYDLLDVDGDASAEEVHAAYMESARLSHPMHVEALGMGSNPRKLEWLFSRLTEAYLVLSDPDRAARYRRGSAPLPSPKSLGPDAKTRRSEKVRLARQYYRVALDYLEEEDYFYAIAMLRQAVLADERAMYWAQLGRCQLGNPRWVHMAVDSFKSAVLLRPEDAHLRQELADAKRLLVEQGGGPKLDEEANRAADGGFGPGRLLAKLRRKID